MTFIDHRVPSNDKPMIYLVRVLFLAMILKSEKVDALSFRFFNPPPSTPTTQTGYNADSSSSPKAIKKSNVVSVTDSNFGELFGGEKPLLLDAFAQWCGPCKLIEPVLEQCAEDWKDSVVVGKFDVEDTKGSRNLKVELILQGVMPRALPALILVHKNKVLDTWKGAISPIQLQEMLEKHVVGNKRAVGSNYDFESSLVEEGSIVCENGVCKRSFKTTNHLDNEKSVSFRGIGLVNNF